MSQDDAPIQERYAVPTAGQGGMTALHHAAYCNDPEAVRAALRLGIPVDARDDGEWTALHWSIDMAQAWGEPEQVVALLLAASASPSAADNLQRSVLMVACGRNNESIVDQLLRAGADVHARGPRDTTPLHEAARHDFAAVVRRLLALGADPNLVDYDGLTAEQVAEKEECEESVAVFDAWRAAQLAQRDAPPTG